MLTVIIKIIARLQVMLLLLVTSKHLTYTEMHAVPTVVLHFAIPIIISLQQDILFFSQVINTF